MESKVDQPSRAKLVGLAQQQLESAIASLDELGFHQAAAHADMALNLLRGSGPVSDEEAEDCGKDAAVNMP